MTPMVDQFFDDDFGIVSVDIELTRVCDVLLLIACHEKSPKSKFGAHTFGGIKVLFQYKDCLMEAFDQSSYQKYRSACYQNA